MEVKPIPDWRTNSENGGSSNTLPISIRPELERILGETSEVNKNDVFDLTKSLQIDLTKVEAGTYDFDSISEKWILKTRTRLLAVPKIEFIDKFQDKQIEVKKYVDNMKSYDEKLNDRIIQRKIKRDVKFNTYKQEDFEY